MTLIRTNLDYTAKDFDSIRARLFNIVPSAFPDWTDTQIANFGNILVEMFAFVGDVMMFYQDNQANESRWTSARLKRSLLSMAKLIGYQTSGASAATALLTLRLAEPTTGVVIVRAGDLFSTQSASESIVFQAVSDATIPANLDPPIVNFVIEHSANAADSFISTSLGNQSFVLNRSPYLDRSVVIVANNGAYEIVDDFLSSDAVSLHATLTVDENSLARVTFGNGIAGAIPVGTISCQYKVGGGVGGNVASNTIVESMQGYTDELGNEVAVTVTNILRATGGFDAPTVEAIREDAPRRLRSLTRTVTREDYEINAMRVGGVSRALMLSRDEHPAIGENTGRLYIIPKGGGPASLGLIGQVYRMLTEVLPKTITFQLVVQSALYTSVNVSTRVHFARGYLPGRVAALISARVAEFFAERNTDGSRNDNVDFGYYLDGAIAWSDVFNVIRDTEGVRKVDDGLGNLVLNGASDDLTISLEKFPVLGTVDVIDAATGVLL